MRTLRGTVIAVLLALAAGPAGAQPVFSSGQDPLAGSQVFGNKGCAKCHSVNGVGGKIGPDLARVGRPRSFYDLATAMWNHLANMTDRMKQVGIERPKLDAREAGDLVAFLYTLSYFDAPGNQEEGRRLFTGKRCIVCHQVGGAGGVVGPNLDGLKQFGSPMYVIAAMWNHGAAMMEKMREKGIERPSFTGAELRDLLAFLAPRTPGAPEGPVYVLPGRAETGRQLFSQKRCVECHSAAGVGGRVGPDLLDRLVRRTPVEFAAAMWNKAPAMIAVQRARGIAVPQLSAEEMADLVAYLYSVRYFADPGDLRRGWTVATAKGCLNCHAAGGERGKPASDLGKAKGLDSAPAVVAALWNHAIVTPKTPAGQRAPWPQFRPEEMADLVALLRSIGGKP